MLPIQLFSGAGSLTNAATIVAGAAAGTLFGKHLPLRVRESVIPVMGLVVMVIGGMSVGALNDESVTRAVGNSAIVIVLLVLVLGTMLGSWWHLEDQVTRLGEWAHRRLRGSHPVDAPADTQQAAFDASAIPSGAAKTVRSGTPVEGFVSATLVFCIGPMGILGSLQEGLGQGNDQLMVKAVLDGFTAAALAAAFGFAVAGGAAVVLIYQGALTALGWALGRLLPPAELNLLTATGGIILIAMGIRLTGIARIGVAEMLPALILAPSGVALVGLLA